LKKGLALRPLLLAGPVAQEMGLLQAFLIRWLGAEESPVSVIHGDFV